MSSTAADQLIAADMAVTQETLRLFIGPRPEKYLRHWGAMQSSGKKTKAGWHWPAFFVTVPWLLYRKMYLAAAVFFFLPIVIALLLPKSSHYGFGFSIVVAIYAKDWYLVHASSRIKKIFARYADPAVREQKLAQAGGVSVAAAIIGGIVLAVQIGLSVLIVLQTFR